MGEFKDTIKKEVIRKQWCKPLIKFINEKLNYKLIYLGLPGPQALDLLEWIEHIDQVIAFQCRDYPNPSSVDQPREKVLELDAKLRDFEREGKLTTFSLYDGYIEEIVLRSKDINGDEFSQNDVVTIYNLDFCNGITVPLEVIDDEGNLLEYYKSDAIKKLLEIQRDISSKIGSKKFIMFLTIHSGFWHEEEKKFISQAESEPLRKYLKKIGYLKGNAKRIRLLKAYIFDMLKSYFCNYGFTPEFLPAVYYKGAGTEKNNWLILFTIIGAECKGIAKALYFQNTKSLLNQKFLTVRNKYLDHWHQRNFDETECSKDSVKAFCYSKCYRELWDGKK